MRNLLCMFCLLLSVLGYISVTAVWTYRAKSSPEVPPSDWYLSEMLNRLCHALDLMESCQSETPYREQFRDCIHYDILDTVSLRVR